jgi:hypothetical protein
MQMKHIMSKDGRGLLHLLHHLRYMHIEKPPNLNDLNARVFKQFMWF